MAVSSAAVVRSRRRVRGAALCAALLVLAQPAIARGAQSAGGYSQLRQITVSREADTTVVTLESDGPLPAPQIGMLDAPPRIFLDFTGVTPKLAGMVREQDTILRRIRVAPHSDAPVVTRVVFDLLSAASYRLRPAQAGASRLQIVLTAARGAILGPAPPDRRPQPRLPPQSKPEPLPRPEPDPQQRTPAQPQQPLPPETRERPPAHPQQGLPPETRERPPAQPQQQLPPEPRPQLPAPPSEPRPLARTPAEPAPPAPGKKRPPAVDASAASPQTPAARRDSAAPGLVRYRQQVAGVTERFQGLRDLLLTIDRGTGDVRTDTLESAQTELQDIERTLTALKPADAVRVAHDLLLRACALARTAVRLRLQPGAAGRDAANGNASSAAAGAILLLDRAVVSLNTTASGR